jgi:hypothetical protein
MDFEIHSRRWGHNDTYRIERTSDGWEVRFAAIGGECAKDGSPYLFDNLNHDFISYPSDLGSYFEWLWIKAEEQLLTDAEIRAYLDQLATWVRLTEQNSPRGGMWKGLSPDAEEFSD